uniref:Uncharacterized protein AlNc14C39G3379 n=1 Tax=Albugo laibachii Nc14 TaxID=890382 RepID=F0W9B2_9STRA|nr:conserved hypothetical protein [Albugo laibachii Nc14]CCA18371.1 conserved hypothetical protein [Albugo laibachii Nc14]|eukprot:CCA18371.1 conserved hypothetical protein [Albugo laibachii Nc14]
MSAINLTSMEAQLQQIEDELTRVEEGEAEVQDEEEIELFSAESYSQHRHANSNLSPTSPRRCVSRELIEQAPALSMKNRYHEAAAVPQPFQVFYLLQAIEKSIQVGALLTPSLYIPKEIWQQHHARLAGTALKAQVLQSLKQAFDRINVTLPLVTESNISEFAVALSAFLQVANAQRLILARAFPFLVTESTHGTKYDNGRTENPDNQSSTDAAQKIGKLTNLAFGFGRIIKRQAIAAVERVGAAPNVSVPQHELEEYAASLCSFISAIRNIESLVGVEAINIDAESLKDRQNFSPRLNASTLDNMRSLAFFLDEVVCEIVLRDISILLDTYIRSMTQQLGDFTFEYATQS